MSFIDEIFFYILFDLISIKWLFLFYLIFYMRDQKLIKFLKN
jgi:hypothetical protein